MSISKRCALIAVAVGLSLTSVAHAQAQNPLSPLKGLWNAPDYEAIYNADRVDEYTRRELVGLHATAIEALNAKDYATAEKMIGELVSRKPTTTDSNFLMGLAKTGLGKWDEARTYLEVAVQKEPLRPEPKTRLGLAYVKLDNPDAAKQQRAQLASLDATCKRSCADATWIQDGLVLLDQALGAPPSATLAAVSPASPDTLTAETLNFDPVKYNIVAFQDAADLYDLLTRDGRCAPKTLAAPRQPCALILYRPDDATTGGLSATFKPVFRVDSRASVWAIHDKKLQKLKIEDLYFDITQIIGEEKVAYRSVALIGNAENKANCDKGAPCLSSLVAQDMFRMYGNMPDSVVKIIWGGGMEDPGTVRIR
jgi:tetratricopeptide (TPR) repeat protein